MIRLLCLPALASLALSASAQSGKGSRLAYLDGPVDPYYPGTGFAKLTTAQWIGEPGVTAAAILSIDDMREPAKYEAFIRPILDRLKAIDGAAGRAPLSIFTCQVDPHDAQLQAWLEEGVSIEVHTIRHPCPLLGGGDLAAAKQTVDDCIDLLKGIPNMEPVCFRMPCCDSMNSLSPRFFAEIFNQVTPRGSFLQADSSMFVWFNEKDKELPADLVADGRFTKYMPRLRGWVNWIENYPYPYVIGTKCWEFPSVIPSDWEAQDRHGKNNPKTVEDLQAALDACVIKEGLFTFVFHPHGWIENTQVVELVDHAEKKHGGKIRFLNVREATGRITENLLLGQPLRKPDGSDNGVRVLDLNNDGYMDVVIGNGEMRTTRVWEPQAGVWKDSGFPGRLDQGAAAFGVLRENGFASVSLGGGHDLEGDRRRLYHFDGSGGWQPGAGGPTGSLADPQFSDIDGDGTDELIGAGASYAWEADSWRKLAGTPPSKGTRLVDLDSDGDLDSVFSDAERFEVRLFESKAEGWSIAGRSGKRGEHDPAEEIPPITRADGSDNGAWIHGDRFYWQNEDTVTPQSQVESRSFEFLRTPLPKKVGVLESKPLDPEAARASITTSLDFEFDLLAAEPEVMDPIDMAWGIDGKLWVVEMADYPLGLDGEGQPGGRVRWLRDEDGDGRYEKSVLFIDGLPFPTGVMPWGEGVLILAAPELIYAEDRDRDGAADHREVLYRGFGEGNQQHRANGLRWGLDNWIHLANGDSNGVIESVKTGKKVDISGRDLRIRPDRGDVEATTGRTQYGRNRDDWGNWFGCNNSTPMWHFVLPDHYLKRNPHVASPRPTVNLVRSEGRLGLFPTSQPLERFNDYDNLKRITSACGAMIYRADTLPLYGDAFVCEPVHNLILRLEVAPDGYSFAAARPQQEQAQRREFFSSSDPWCRPVSIRTGPDGCLWVADMYRLVIEHPEWIPKDWQEKLDLRSGHDRGRIYRIRPQDHAPANDFDGRELSTARLVGGLASTNGTVRDLAHQSLLVGLRRKHSIDRERAAIERLLIHPNPATRIQTLSLLDGLGGVGQKDLDRALDDAHPGVRRHALRLYESSATAPPFDKLARFVIDPDPQLRLQLAFSLGEFPDQRAGAILADLARRHGGDAHLAAAVLSSAIPHLDALAGAMPEFADPLKRSLLATIAKQGKGQEILASLSDTGDFESAAVLLQALGSIDRSKLRPLIDAAKSAVFEAKPPSVAAVRLLGIVGETEQLEQLLEPGFPPDVQAAAAGAITSPEVLLRDWSGHSPALRAEIVATLTKDQNCAAAVLRHFADSPGAGGAFRSFLTNHSEESVRVRAQQLFGQLATTRGEAIARYRGAAGDPGADTANGRTIFERNCAVCHALDGIGKPVGPDLRALTDRSPDSLLAAILDPNRAIEDKYRSYLVRLHDGSARLGMISSETSTALVLTLPDGSSESILRSDVKTIESTGRSLMPEGLEAAIQLEEMRDLIAWLAQSPTSPRSFPGNTPGTIAAGQDGSFRLGADRAEIYGERLVFEAKYQNLGFWESKVDRAVWVIDCQKPGEYRVEIDFACAGDVAGNQFRIGPLTGTVPSTGSWDEYQQKRVGTIRLVRGLNRIAFGSAGPIKGFLLDLRSVTLVPE